MERAMHIKNMQPRDSGDIYTCADSTTARPSMCCALPQLLAMS